MDLISRAAANLRGAPQRRAVGQWGDSSIPPNSMAGSLLPAGAQFVNEATVRAISTVLSCLRVLFEDVASLPFYAWEGEKHGARKLAARQPQIVSRPFGPDLKRGTGMGQITYSLKMRGNAYLEVVQKDRQGLPTQLQVLHPDAVQPFIDPDDGLKKFRVTLPNSAHIIAGPDRIKHIMGLSLPGAIKALDPITEQRQAWGLARDVAIYGQRFFSGGGSPSGVIEVPGFLDGKGIRRIRDGWDAAHGGVFQSHRPAVISGGAQWKQIQVTPENAQFLGTREFSREEICGWFGVPLQRVMAITDHASQGGGKGLNQIDQGYAQHTLLPLAEMIEEVWDDFIDGGDATWSQFRLDNVVRADPMTRAQIRQIDRLTGVRNRNEARAEEGWWPIDGPDGTDYNAPFATNSNVPSLIDPNLAADAQAGDATDAGPAGGQEGKP